MKVCPSCRTTFDDSQNFCLTDGTPLVSAEPEPETVVAAREPNVVQPAKYPNLPPVATPQQPARAKSNMSLIIGATALFTVLLVGLGAAGWWYFSRSGGNQRAAQTNTNSVLNSNSAPRVSPSPSVSNSSANANATNSAIVLTNTANAQNSPTPENEINGADAAEIRKEATGALNAWAGALGSNSLDEHLSYYADTLDYYYNARGYSRNRVRADKQRAFAAFDSMEINVSNVRVTPDASGERATVVYDKEWTFEGENKTNEGKTQSQLELRKIGGRWLIVGERDIKVYNQESY